MKRILILVTLWTIQFSLLSQDLKSPSAFLGYELGTQFTWHHDILSYCKYVAGNSDLVEYLPYGKTYEGRELGVCIISSPENLEHLEDYRRNNLINIGLLEGSSTGSQVPFIWLAFNVHGNEATGSEAALKTIYTLVTNAFEGSSGWLEKGVIIIDPCQNPDGRDRNTARYRMTNSGTINVNRDDWSHHETWPGSRTNHYLFDLNRDWVWQTQVETRQRVELYNRFMPHVHADFHEMGGKATFFPPSAEPWHEAITPFQKEFHRLIGDEIAELFDNHYRQYFTKERYDMLYPGYGDTWPSMNGAIGFTVEQGRGSSSAIDQELDHKDTLTLKERIDGHFLAAIGTVKAATGNGDRLISEFNSYFSTGEEDPVFEYGTVVIKGSNDRAAMSDLLVLLERNQIRYSYANTGGKERVGFDYLGNRESEFSVERGDILVSAFQPQSHLVKVLFDPDSELTDSVTYGFTAWSLPYLFNVKAYAVKEKLAGTDGQATSGFIANAVPERSPYAFIAAWSGFNEARLISELFKMDANIRYALKSFTLDGKQYPRGTLIIMKADNPHLEDSFDKMVVNVANKCEVTVDPAMTGLSETGADLGSYQYTSFSDKPEIALIAGSDVSSSSFGQLWYFFEREISYPVTILNTDYLNSVDLSQYDLILMPSGNYARFHDQLFDYLREGGRVAAFERANELFASDSSTNLSSSQKKRNKELDDKKDKVLSSDTSLLKRYEDREREQLSEASLASIYRVRLDDSHPYAYGLGTNWFIIKGSRHYPFLSRGENIGYVLENDPVSGFAGYKFREEVRNTMIVGSERIGQGEVIYLADNPYTMAFWKSGRVLLANILFRK